MALGVAFGLGLFLTSVFDSDPWNDHTYDIAPPIVSGAPAPHQDGREAMVCSSCHAVVPMKMAAGQTRGLFPIIQGAPSPHLDQRKDMACASCHTILPKGKGLPKGTGLAKTAPPPPPQALAAPRALTVALPVAVANPPVPSPAVLDPEAHERFLPFRFQGRVSRVAVTGKRAAWGDVYVLVDGGINPPRWIDLAPWVYLRAGGCHVRTGMFIKGTAYRDPADTPTSLAYGKNLVVNGELCPLRDNHLTGMWEQAGGADVEER
ncbi:MAG: magnetochrome domain-containing protein [Alphaproteobacteria bacterium]|nr:magnetochrome domain-containing protein [Alphaproteobacteria bacterium]